MNEGNNSFSRFDQNSFLTFSPFKNYYYPIVRGFEFRIMASSYLPTSMKTKREKGEPKVRKTLVEMAKETAIR